MHGAGTESRITFLLLRGSKHFSPSNPEASSGPRIEKSIGDSTTAAVNEKLNCMPVDISVDMATPVEPMKGSKGANQVWKGLSPT